MEDYKPFMSKGFVSIDDNTASKPIRILRDTGASQSLLLEGVLPLSENTSVGKDHLRMMSVFLSSPWLWLQHRPGKYQRLLPTSQHQQLAH
jgi:hypothetical protein